jgi:hypothetical protein
LVSLALAFSFMCCWAANIMAEPSHCCQCCDRNTVYWLMYDSDLGLLPGDNEGSGDVMVTGHYHACCCWRSLNIPVSVTVGQTAPHAFLCSQGFGLFFANLLICDLIIRSSLNSIPVDLIGGYWEVVNFYDMLAVFEEVLEIPRAWRPFLFGSLSSMIPQNALE